MKNETIHGIKFSLPTVVLLQQTGIGTAELAARTCYDSFEASEHEIVKVFNTVPDATKAENPQILDVVNGIEHSELLDTLAWTHFHHSILEHANLTYLIKGTSRGVLQEHARHRIQAISVRSTRYTMSSVINAFVAELAENYTNTQASAWFRETLTKLDLFVTADAEYNNLQIQDIFMKLKFQAKSIGYAEFIKLAVAKSSLDFVANADSSQALFKALQDGKKKRNVGDAFKHIVNDNFKTDMIVTFNLRSLKNYFTLRDSGSAYFQIRNLAKAMKEVTPNKYLDLIVKD